MSAPDRSASRQEPARAPRERFPAIDGLRFLAALGVLFHHVWNASDAVNDPVIGPLLGHLEVLVAVFFLVSAFLLYLPWVRAHLEDRPLPASVPFLWRRGLRLFPAYWLALVLLGLIDQRGVLFHTPADYVYYFGYIWIYSPAHLIAPITQAWTVASEALWYLVIPVLGFAVCRTPGTLRRKLTVHLATVVVFGITAFVFTAATSDSGSNRLMYSQWLITYLDAVGLGMLFAIVVAWQRLPGVRRVRWLDDRRLPAACWIVAIGGYTAMCFWTGLPIDRFTYTPRQYVGEHFTVVLLAALLLAPLVLGPVREGRLRGFLSTRVIAWLGLVSYGIYLWHVYWIGKYSEWFDVAPHQLSMVPALAFVIPMSIGTAALSYYVVERPTQRWGQRVRIPGATGPR